MRNPRLGNAAFMRRAQAAIVAGTLMAMVPLASAADAPAPASQPDMLRPASKEIPGLLIAPRWVSAVGCLTSAAHYYRMDTPDPWICGGSGFAFSLNLHDKIDISGPTAWDFSRCYDLAGNVGLNVEGMFYAHDKDFAKNQEVVWNRLCNAIARDEACYAWAMDVPEYYLIFGYDDKGNYLFRNFDNAPRKLPHTKLSEAGWPIWAAIVHKGKVADADKVITDALQFALDDAAGRYAKAPYHSGLLGYDAWIKALQDDTLKEGPGNAYNAQCWAECRQNAVEFLRGAAGQTQDAKRKALLEEAAESYDIVAGELKAVADEFPFNPGNDAGMRKMYADKPRRERGVAHLQSARTAEERGLAVIAEIVGK